MSKIAEQRIFDCLNIDKKKCPEGAKELLKVDILKTLNNYFQVDDNNIVIKTEVNQDGTYSIKMVAKAKSVKTLNFLR